MKKTVYSITILILFAFALTANSQDKKGKSVADNSISKKEAKQGWKLLFDGKSGNAWMNSKTGTFPSGGWVIEDGLLKIKPGSDGGDIVSKDKFRNFELMLDFRYTPGANSGIKYFIDTERDGGKMASIGCEYQILDDRLHPDAKAGKNGNRKLSSLYDLIPAQNVKDNGSDQWNTARIVVNGNKVQHWINGQMTVEYERGSETWKKAVSESKFNKTSGFGDVQDTRILLQDHGNEVWFRNIKIREIK
ncbi:MAG TPA: DUF1080 domain-containing protein [Bacteroidales bacterium]|jgi:hypothetical protein|nr:DUF1080 domain-containing protein [Bacteroidales bacterium]